MDCTNDITSCAAFQQGEAVVVRVSKSNPPFFVLGQEFLDRWPQSMWTLFNVPTFILSFKKCGVMEPNVFGDFLVMQGKFLFELAICMPCVNEQKICLRDFNFQIAFLHKLELNSGCLGSLRSGKYFRTLVGVDPCV